MKATFFLFENIVNDFFQLIAWNQLSWNLIEIYIVCFQIEFYIFLSFILLSLLIKVSKESLTYAL